MNKISERLIIDETERLDITARVFGTHYPFRIEPSIYRIASSLSADYDGGLWDFYELSNNGFFQSPPDKDYEIVCQNGFEAVVPSIAFGIISCLYTYSTLSFKPELQELMSHHYYLLREYALDHHNSGLIFRAID